jgi:hypothetical protein
MRKNNKLHKEIYWKIIELFTKPKGLERFDIWTTTNTQEK